jgi:alpha-tubulin suppressor-like RCC1 family protein
LCVGNTIDSISPLQINGIADAVDASAGNSHSMILNAKGIVYTCGRNNVFI